MDGRAIDAPQALQSTPVQYAELLRVITGKYDSRDRVLITEAREWRKGIQALLVRQFSCYRVEDARSVVLADCRAREAEPDMGARRVHF